MRRAQWRYSTPLERTCSVASALVACACSCALLCAIVVYGEITSLFVQRHRATATTPHVYILTLFGGGRRLSEGNRTGHMDALVEDSIAFGLASVAIMAAKLTAAAISVTLANWAANRMVSRLRWRLLRAVITQEVAFFDTNTNMNFASALTEDMDKLKAGVGEHVAMTAFLGGTVVLGAALSLTYGWQLTLAGLSVVPVSIIVAGVVAKYQTKWSAEEVKAYGSAGRVVEEALAAIRTVRAYAGEEKELERYEWSLRSASIAATRRGWWAGAGAGAGWLLTYALNAVVFAYGAALCVRDMDLPPEMQYYHPGIMLTILFCTFMAAQNIAMCQPHLETFSTARGAAKSLFKLLERKSKINALEQTGLKPEKFKGDIVFDNLYFNYPSRPDVKVLRGLTLRVRAGETVALVGGSGCGKSTLLQLLQRLYDPDSGQVYVDGHQLLNLDLHHFRTSIGVVGQEPVLFSGTIRENIAFGAEASDAEIIAAAKTANAHSFITKLAKGYDTMLGSNGTSLSGGQKQRVAIARALLRNPSILLLDEPTSALDPAAERLVQAALDAASKGRTTLVVSHRLSTIVNATRIVYMEQGAVLEEGTHMELLEKKGLYWKLVQDDMTHKSAMAALSAEDELDDVEEIPKETFRRASVQRLSTHRESMIRASKRMGSISSNLPVPDIIQQTGIEPEDEVDEVPDVSTWQLLKLNAPEWKLLVGGALASLLVGATMPTFALLLSKLYGMFSWSDRQLILSESLKYAGYFLLAAAACGAVTFLQAWLFAKAGIKLTDRLRKMCFGNYLRQDQAWFDSSANSVGALCARLSSDCAAVQGATGSRLGAILQGVSTMSIGVTLAMFYSWKMTLVSLLSVPCVMGGIWLESWVSRRAEQSERKSLEKASRLATEAVLNLRTVQTLGVEQTVLDRYTSSLQSSETCSLTACVRGPVYGLCLCAPTLGYAVSLAYGGYLIAREDLPYASAVLVAEALIYGAWMLAEALSFAPNFAAAKRSGARIIRALDTQPSVVTENSAKEEPGWTAQGNLEFSAIEFRYPTRPTVPVLKSINLQLRAGKTLALVGPSGCGKSTLVQLLQRGYDPISGTIRIDGRDIKRSLTLSQLRSQLGLVQQEPSLFSRSIRDNIAYGDNTRDVPLEEIIDAATKANVHTFIAGLPLGYDTVLGGGGASLSGGQKQRVAIARALLRHPRILLLDEPTSALDANSEKVVQAALEAAAADRTTIIIAHRLATVRHADQIAVIHQGVVAELGSHDELVRKRGLYWELLKQQAPAEAT
ncbi:hypothetical protein evm_001249 [Chilo suppressalis]|nr:hypothetical protein evm_001249 [Chilo suppressalis]